VSNTIQYEKEEADGTRRKYSDLGMHLGQYCWKKILLLVKQDVVAVELLKDGRPAQRRMHSRDEETTKSRR
jgi:hypothetical protein